MNTTLLRRYRWPAIGLLAAGLSTIHPTGTPRRTIGPTSPLDHLHAPPEVAAILTRSCADCHSNHTVWPWYSYIAPVSWLVERDVTAGRDHLNLSRWDQYSFTQREKFLADIASAVKNHEMPVPQYTLIHRNSALSDADADAIYYWARAERRKLKLSPQD